MRVLVVPKWYPWPERPVFGIFCREQARALARHHDVVVLASEPARRPSFPLFEVGDHVEDGLRTIRLRYRRPRLRAAAMACQLAGMLAVLVRLRRERWRPDVVHAHVYSAGLPALALGRLSGAPVVVSEHYTGFQRGLITGSDRLTAWLAFGRADLVAPVSSDLAARIREIAPRARVRVVANVVDTDVFYPPRAQAAGPEARTQAAALEVQPQAAVLRPSALLTVAALVPKKGHADLLAALALMSAGGAGAVTLDIVGDGELRAQLVERAGRLGLAQRVRFHGERSKEQVAEQMRHADLFVLPSLFENLPCVLIEAMASGLPVVATAVGGVPELIDGDGVLCRPGDPAALATAIEGMLRRRAQIDAPAMAARTRERYGYEAFARAWSGIYEELRARDR